MSRIDSGIGGSGGLETVRGENLFLYLSRIEGAGAYKDKILQLLGVFGGEQTEVFEHRNHAGAAVEMTVAHRKPRIRNSGSHRPGRTDALEDGRRPRRAARFA